MKKFFYLCFLGGSVFAFQHFLGLYLGEAAEASEKAFWEEIKQEQLYRSSVRPEEFNFTHYKISDGDTFATALEKMGVGYSDTVAIMTASNEVHDFTKVRLGEELRIDKSDGRISRLEYDLNSDEMIVVSRTDEIFSAELEEIFYQEKEVAKANTIRSSLFAAANDVGVADKAIIEMAEIFAWNIDFALQVQKGDSFKILYKERFRDGEAASSGDILAATFTTGGETYKAYQFEMPDGTKKYFDENGASLVRQFMKSPLKYSRITSGFSYGRFHPILGKNMPHLAIDYAAPIGTPIYAVGDGKIVLSGWKGGYGNYIDIRHNGTYKTQYAHLSKFAKGISPGVRVKQGDVIGYVGSTGFSTGPHLHYQVEKNGQLMNPNNLDLPKGEGIAEDLKEAFDKVRTELDQKLPKN